MNAPSCPTRLQQTRAVRAHHSAIRRVAPAPTAARWSRLLSPREADVLRCIARGMSNAEVAAELFIAQATVKTHVARLLPKVGARDRVQLVVAAYTTGFVTAA